MNRKDALILDFAGSVGAILLAIASMYYFGQMLDDAGKIFLYVLSLVIVLASLPGIACVRFLTRKTGSDLTHASTEAESSQSDRNASTRQEALEEALTAAGSSALSGLISRLAQLGRPEEALTALREISSETARASALVRLAPYLSENLLEEALTAAREIRSVSARAFTLMELTPYLGSSLRAQAADEMERLAQWLVEGMCSQEKEMSNHLQASQRTSHQIIARAFLEQHFYEFLREEESLSLFVARTATTFQSFRLSDWLDQLAEWQHAVARTAATASDADAVLQMLKEIGEMLEASKPREIEATIDSEVPEVDQENEG